MFGREPVLWTAAIRSIVLLLVLFGADLTDAQVTGIMVAVEAVIALITRTQTTPVSSPQNNAGVPLKSILLVLALSGTLLSGCAAMSNLFQFNDPVKTTLYATNQTYLQAREAALINHSKKVLSDADMKRFQAADKQFTEKYNEIVQLYFAAKPITQAALDEITKLSEEVKALSAPKKTTMAKRAREYAWNLSPVAA